MQSRYLAFHSIPRVLHHGEQKALLIHLAPPPVSRFPVLAAARLASVLYPSTQLTDNARKLGVTSAITWEHRMLSNRNALGAAVKKGRKGEKKESTLHFTEQRFRATEASLRAPRRRG